MTFNDPKTRTDASSWVVHKFGGSSVADAQCFERVAQIIESQPDAQLAVVLSACKGITDALLDLVTLAETQQPSWREKLLAVRERHAGIASTLLNADAAAGYMARFDRDLQDIEGVLQTTSIMRSAAQTVRDLCSGFGEIWSTRLFVRYLNRRGVLRGAQWIDARRCVTVEWGPLGPAVQWQS